MTTTIEIRSVAALRSCFRCGNDFRQEGGNRICPTCRNPEPRRKRPLNPNLSFRERQVVYLVCQAKLNKEIAHELHLTEGTIKEYLNRIFRKLGFSNRTELAIWGLTHLPRQAGEDSLELASGGYRTLAVSG